MSHTTDLLSDYTVHVDETDVLSSALGALHISGSLVLHHVYRTPWAIQVPSSSELALLTGAPPDARVVAFHFVERGELTLTTTGVPKKNVCAGELVACFGGADHHLTRGQDAPIVPLAGILAGHASPPHGDDRPESTRLLCGVFVLRDTSLNPLLAALPPVVHASMTEDDLELFARVLRRELRHAGNASSFIIDRVLEMLCAALVRDQITKTSEDAVGLLRTLKDPRLSRALEQVHKAPAAPWTIDSLSKSAGLSRSRFSARFRQLAGVAPMVYVTRWRMNVAARMLRRTEHSVAEIAGFVGYESVPTFTRVFKRYLGDSPGRFRDVVRQGATS